MMTDCKQNSKIGVYLLSLFAILFWGMSYIWSDSLLSMGIPVEYVVFVRIAIAAVFLLFWNIARRKSLRIHRWDVPKFLLVAMFEPLIYFVTETYGIQLTDLRPTVPSSLPWARYFPYWLAYWHSGRKSPLSTYSAFWYVSVASCLSRWSPIRSAKPSGWDSCCWS